MEILKELEEIVFEDPAIEKRITPSKLNEMSIEKIEELYLEFERRNDNQKKIIDIFSKYPSIRSIAIGAGKILAISEKPEGFNDDYLGGLGDGAKSFIYCFSGNDLIEGIRFNPLENL